jgi:heme a synthase
MVKSGLEEPKSKTDIPRVSQYRLAAHLGSAFLLYAGFFSTALTHLFQNEKMPANVVSSGVLKTIKMRSHIMMSLVFVTALAGAFVAGLDAGLVYNNFPKMGDNWLPEGLLSIEPKWKNFFENPTTVQFQHRYLGITTLLGITTFVLSLRKHSLPRRARLAANAMLAMAWCQVGLGVATLLTYVPVSLAAVHQSGSLTLLSFAIWLANELKRIPK